jgi:DnaK suppressor protein
MLYSALITEIGVNGNHLREVSMDAKKLEHFRILLLQQKAEHAEHIRNDHAAAIELSDDGVKDSSDLSVMDVNKELALRLGERESQMVADIDQALLRIREGSYGICVHCGKPIDERRLEALPTARYDASCQTAIESADGLRANPTL